MKNKTKKSLSKEGKNNPAYIDGRTLKEHRCINCGKKVSSYQSKRCRGCYLKSRKSVKGKDNPMYGKKGKLSPNWSRVTLYCRTCGVRYEVKLYMKTVSKCCSVKCFNKYKKIIYAGKGAPGYIDGRSFEPYPQRFKALRSTILTRDKFICQHCLKPQNENWVGGKLERLSVHHIDYVKQNCKLSNLISLCRTCNIKANTNREYWEGYFRAKRVSEVKSKI